jgi:hypothetical protein
MTGILDKPKSVSGAIEAKHNVIKLYVSQANCQLKCQRKLIFHPDTPALTNNTRGCDAPCINNAVTHECLSSGKGTAASNNVCEVCREHTNATRHDPMFVGHMRGNDTARAATAAPSIRSNGAAATFQCHDSSIQVLGQPQATPNSSLMNLGESEIMETTCGCVDATGASAGNSNGVGQLTLTCEGC